MGFVAGTVILLPVVYEFEKKKRWERISPTATIMPLKESGQICTPGLLLRAHQVGSCALLNWPIETKDGQLAGALGE